MSTLWRIVEFLSLSIWLGSVVFLSFVVAPGAFAVLGSRDQAGALVALVLGRMHFLGIGAGLIFLVARLLRAQTFAALVAPAALAVVLMLLLTFVSQMGVSTRMARLKAEMGSVERTPANNPLRVEFDKLHRVSVGLETFVLLSGIAALVLLVREKPL
ncbi:MAG TPA: DUF4149 domain-containing protein [Candidatus Acidoferrales bacterium]|nr:DUF4149 domain-containing protein [Candidatus Acidoferrales bacterium]